MTAATARARDKRRTLIGLAVFVLALVIAPLATKAEDFDAAKHFKGKSIRLMVDFKPGGGTDLQARYFAANWGKFIPGAPRMTVSNMFPKPAARNFT